MTARRTGEWTRVVLSLGANLGDPAAQLDAAVLAIASLDGVELIAQSRRWRSPAWVPPGETPGADYLNRAVLVDTQLSPRVLMDRLLEIEADFGRIRDERTAGFGDRPLDIDIIEWLGRASDEGVDLPHPRAHLRDFVLAPWLELDADAHLTGHGRVDALLGSLERSAVPEHRS